VNYPPLIKYEKLFGYRPTDSHLPLTAQLRPSHA
jgi:hypothetical protein